MESSGQVSRKVLCWRGILSPKNMLLDGLTESEHAPKFYPALCCPYLHNKYSLASTTVEIVQI